MKFSRNGSCSQYGRRARFALCFALIPTACQSPLSGTGGTLDAQEGRLAPQIQKWHVTELAHLEPPPDGIAVNSAGDVYFTQHSAQRARILFPNGKIETVGKGLLDPYAIAPFHALTYIADSGNKLVKRVLANGNIQLVGTGWVDPHGVAVDASGALYVVDVGTGTVTRIKPNGKASVVVPESLCGSSMLGVSVDATGVVYVPCFKSPGTFTVFNQTVPPQPFVQDGQVRKPLQTMVKETFT